MRRYIVPLKDVSLNAFFFGHVPLTVAVVNVSRPESLVERLKRMCTEQGTALHITGIELQASPAKKNKTKNKKQKKATKKKEPVGLFKCVC